MQPLTGDEHWFERNAEHFEQLLLQMAKGEVVPIVGAGLSVGGRFPTWQDHLRQPGKTANIASEHIEALLAAGEFETIIAEIEAKPRRTFVGCSSSESGPLSLPVRLHQSLPFHGSNQIDRFPRRGITKARRFA